MKGEEEIRRRLEELEADGRLYYRTASVQVNAPLAIHQACATTETEIAALRWVLGRPPRNWRELRGEEK